MLSAAFARAADPPVDSRSTTLPPAGYSVAILAVSVNREAQDEPIVALRDVAGTVLIAASDLGRWRIRIPAVEPIAFGGERYIPVSALPGLGAQLDEQTQVLTITAAAELFQSTALDAQGRAAPTAQRSATGGFLNYTLLASRIDSDIATSGSFELGAFGRFGAATTTAVVSRAADQTQFTRLDSTWTYALPERMSTLRAGDIITRAGAWGNSLRVGGVQFATDFATQPSLVLTPGQFASGQATVPSTVDVFINNALVSQQSVKPGPFSITNIPPITGSGNVTLVVRDELGREQVITRPFYASQSLLRTGLTDFSIDLGLVRENYGVTSADYGPWIAAGTYRRGLTDRVTGEVRGEVLSGLANAGVGLSMLVADFGVMSASVAGGHGTEGNGGRASIGFERQSRGLSFALFGAWRSPNFRLAGETDPATLPSREYLASVDYSFGRVGTVALAYVERQVRQQPATRIGTIAYSVSLDQWGFVSASLSHVRSLESTTSFNVLWTMPLGATTSATLGYERSQRSQGGTNGVDGVRDDKTLSIQRNLPVGEGWGYRLRLADESKQGALNYQNRYGTYSAEIAQAQGEIGQRVSASGGLGIISGRTFMSRTITESFGLVRLPGYPNVQVYAENRVIGRTNADGELIVPRLLPYQRNSLRIDQNDIPLDSEFDMLTKDAIPYARSGVVVDFAVKLTRGALVRIVEADGNSVPAGAQVRVVGQDLASPVALDGDVYLTNLATRNKAVVTWTDRSCEFEFEFPQTTDPQPRLGPFVCRTLQ